MNRFVIIFLVLSLLLTGCKPVADEPVAEIPPVTLPLADQAEEQQEVVSTNPPPADEPKPTETLLPTPPEPTQPPEPQQVTFKAGDGKDVQGIFYPAARLNLPVVVFVHWVGGDMSDWYEIAAWLQNRGQENPYQNPADEPWWDPTWFPSIDAGVSYNVLIFSLRTCQPYKAGCGDWDVNGWLADIHGALQKSILLPGVDASRVAVIGSSIGADGAADGCAWLNTQQPDACRGALSLSPGDYLGIPYPQVIKELSDSQPAVPAWCLADEKEIGVCNSAGVYPTFRAIEIPGGNHGTRLLRPGLEPLPMQIILDFLYQTLGED